MKLSDEIRRDLELWQKQVELKYQQWLLDLEKKFGDDKK